MVGFLHGFDLGWEHIALTEGAFETTWNTLSSHSGESTDHRTVPCLTILAHPNMYRAGERAFLWQLNRGGSEHFSRKQLDFATPGKGFGQPLQDPFLSRTPIVLELGAKGMLRLSVPPKTLLKVNGTIATGVVEIPQTSLEQGVTLSLEKRICLLLHLAQSQNGGGVGDMGMVGESDGMVKVREAIRHVAAMDVPVLIRGETGTGKELIAQALHHMGTRSSKPFVSVSLAAIPASLAASELFGAAKGAFTGASGAQQGYFRAAHSGVLFLDEIGEASPEIQAMLLRVLETGEIYPLGRQTPLKVDVRLIAATDANLDEMMADKTFKAPLLHRLSGFEIRIPPLRQRREDVGRLFLHFARKDLEELGITARLQPSGPREPAWMPADLCCALARYSWPGNIRQFRNIVRQLVIENRDRATLTPDSRLAELLQDLTPTEHPKASPPRRKPADIGRQELRATLSESNWEYKICADKLGIARSSLYDLMAKHGIPMAHDISDQAIKSCMQEHGDDLAAMSRQLQVSQRSLKQRMKLLKLPK